jgi:multidrug efflux pump subunit AcrA (membrane-fusion protein)
MRWAIVLSALLLGSAALADFNLGEIEQLDKLEQQDLLGAARKAAGAWDFDTAERYLAQARQKGQADADLKAVETLIADNRADKLAKEQQAAAAQAAAQAAEAQRQATFAAAQRQAAQRQSSSYGSTSGTSDSASGNSDDSKSDTNSGSDSGNVTATSSSGKDYSCHIYCSNSRSDLNGSTDIAITANGYSEAAQIATSRADQACSDAGYPEGGLPGEDVGISQCSEK